MFGSGIVKGMMETARNFVGSYHDPNRLVTVEYPDKRLPPKENARNFPFLVYDGADPMAGLRCVACKICEKECPPQCIYIEIQRDGRGKAMKHPEVFDLDTAVCMSCQICVEVCPFDSIKMDTRFELSQDDRFLPLLMDKHALAKSNEYYHEIHATEAAEVDAHLAKRNRKAIPSIQPPAPVIPPPKPPSRPVGAAPSTTTPREKAALAA